MMLKTSYMLRRLMGGRRRRRMLMRCNNNSNTSNTHIATYTIATSHLNNSSHFFNYQPFFGGYKYKWSANQARCIHYYSEPEEPIKENIIKKGDIVNLSQLLFTKDRDYLIRYNDPQMVTAEHLAGKLVVLYFVPLYLIPDPFPPDRLYTESLINIYNELKLKNCFEVVLVVVDDITSSNGEFGPPSLYPSLQRTFENIFSKCPSWAAIPFSDIISRKRLQSEFGHSGRITGPEMVLIDSIGRVLDTFPQLLFQKYGIEAYPFTDDRMAFLNSKDKTAFSQHSLKKLLGSSERDFVISNKGEEVPIRTLEDKVVVLYFYEDGFSPDFLTSKLKMYYKKLKTDQNFEVVLLYLHDTDRTIHSTMETFKRTLETMPWLALPYKDPVHKKLKRLFGYPDERYNFLEEPTLVIVGPRSDIIEPVAATILSGHDGKLIMPAELAKVEGGKRVGGLKLEMLFTPNNVFKRKDGSQVQFSQLVGKRIIILFEGDYPEYDGGNFEVSLEATYMRMKGTVDEFEVIYFLNNRDENGKRVADMPWLISRAVDLSPDCSAFLSFYGNCYNRYHSSLLLAFGRDGSLVRKTICPWFGDDYFPFHADGVGAFDIERSNFCWGYWDTLYKGLLRDSSKQINFPTSDHLFCVYYYQG